MDLTYHSTLFPPTQAARLENPASQAAIPYLFSICGQFQDFLSEFLCYLKICIFFYCLL